MILCVDYVTGSAGSSIIGGLISLLLKDYKFSDVYGQARRVFSHGNRFSRAPPNFLLMEIATVTEKRLGMVCERYGNVGVLLSSSV